MLSYRIDDSISKDGVLGKPYVFLLELSFILHQLRKKSAMFDGAVTPFSLELHLSIFTLVCKKHSSEIN